MKWYHYLDCFLAGVFLIHIVPHVMNGFSLRNVLGFLVSLGGGCLFLWAGKFSWRNPWCVILLLAGMAAVFLFTQLHPHHHVAKGHPTHWLRENDPDHLASITSFSSQSASA